MSTALAKAESLLQELDIPSLEREALAITVVDQTSYDAICEVSKRAVALRKKITDEIIGPGKTAADKSHKEWCALEKKLLALCAGAETISKAKIDVWENEQETIRLREQYRLEAEARKRAEDELLAAALAAEDDGASLEEAQTILETPMPRTVVVAPKTFQRAQGISRSESWEAELTDKRAFVRWVAAHPEFIHLVDANIVALNQLAERQKTLMNIPGVMAVRGSTIRVRT